METKSIVKRKSFFTNRRFSKANKLINELPVIKISRDGFLLSANNEGVIFLEQLTSNLKVSSVNFIIQSCGALLQPNCSIDLCYDVNNVKYFFSAVAFSEAGYVGLYGYRKILS